MQRRDVLLRYWETGSLVSRTRRGNLQASLAGDDFAKCAVRAILGATPSRHQPNHSSVPDPLTLLNARLIEQMVIVKVVVVMLVNCVEKKTSLLLDMNVS
jgi:hypothetical protein